ncbi:MAG: YidC/Oxa1 family membrane protein insertase [Clostridia bacterium]|nr:YidC/Oxa1 family membrane protein insertase [Clostridia bacterium]
MIQAIASFLGMIIRVIYNLVNQNYLLSILIFTLLTKLILLPLTLGQIKLTKKLQEVTPLDQKIREKYKNDQQKMAEELTKLYSEYKINPLGGCLPLLIQFPIIIAMFFIVRQPLTYITQTPHEEIVQYTKDYLGKEEVDENEVKANEIVIAQEQGIINMKLFGNVNLGDIPSNSFSKDEAKKVSKLTLLVPILSFLFSLLQTKLQKNSTQMTEDQQEMQKSMNIMLPLLNAFIAYTWPITLGIYYLFSNILGVIQQEFINKVILKKGNNKKEEVLKLGKGGK